MKKQDIIKLVEESVKEMRASYGVHDTYGASPRQTRNLSGYPGVMENNEETITGEYEGKPVNFKIKDIPTLKDIIDVSISSKDFVNKVTMAVTDETSSLSKEDIKKLILFYNKRTRGSATSLPLNEMNEEETLKKKYFQKVSAEDFANKIPKGTKLLYLGGSYRVVNNHGYVLELEPIDDKGNPIKGERNTMINLNQFSRSGQINEKGMKETKLYTVTAADGTEKQVPFPNDSEAKKAIRHTNIKKVEPMEEDAEEIKFTNDVGKDDYVDDEGRMAKSQLYKMAKYAVKLHKMLDDMEQLPAWVQAKFTKASDYLSSIYHYLDYEFARRDSDLMEEIDKHKEEVLNELTEEPNEGNAFAVARLQAIKKGEKKFKVGGKEFDVTDVSDDDKKAAEKL